MVVVLVLVWVLRGVDFVQTGAKSRRLSFCVPRLKSHADCKGQRNRSMTFVLRSNADSQFLT